MKRKIEVEVGSLGETFDRFERVSARAEKSAARSVEGKLTFESLPVLLQQRHCG